MFVFRYELDSYQVEYQTITALRGGEWLLVEEEATVIPPPLSIIQFAVERSLV